MGTEQVLWLVDDKGNHGDEWVAVTAVRMVMNLGSNNNHGDEQWELHQHQ